MEIKLYTFFGIHALLALAMLLMGFWILLKNRKSTVNIVYFLINLNVIVAYSFTTATGGLISDPELARIVFLPNIAVVFISPLFIHWAFALTKKQNEKKHIISFFYFLSFGIFTLLVTHLDLFIPSVEPVLFLRNYLVIGPLYDVMMVFFFLGLIYGLTHLFYEYFKAESSNHKTRILYTILGTVVGYVLGGSQFLITYGIYQVGIYPSAFCGIYSLIIGYAVFKHNLMDIKVVVRKTFLYALSVSVLAWIIFGITYANQWFVSNVSWGSRWFVPLLVSILSVVIFYIIWRQLEAFDKTRREFLTIAAHRFRTPLTRIRHGVDLLLEETNIAKDKQDGVGIVNNSRELLERLRKDNLELIELTSLMLESERFVRVKKEMFETVDLADLIYKIVASNRHNLEHKNINFDLLTFESSVIKCHKEKIKSLFEILIDNILHYTNHGGSASISIDKVSNQEKIFVCLKNTGYIIPDKEKRKIFESFYRLDNGKELNTEGTGLGLFLAKKIVEQHRGEIWVETGEDCNSVNFILPIH